MPSPDPCWEGNQSGLQRKVHRGWCSRQLAGAWRAGFPSGMQSGPRALPRAACQVGPAVRLTVRRSEWNWQGGQPSRANNRVSQGERFRPHPRQAKASLRSRTGSWHWADPWCVAGHDAVVANHDVGPELGFCLVDRPHAATVGSHEGDVPRQRQTGACRIQVNLVATIECCDLSRSDQQSDGGPIEVGHRHTPCRGLRDQAGSYRGACRQQRACQRRGERYPAQPVRETTN